MSSAIFTADGLIDVLDPSKAKPSVDGREGVAFESALKYRQLDELWGLSGPNVGCSGKASYRTTISAEDRALLALAADEARRYQVRADVQERNTVVADDRNRHSRAVHHIPHR